MGHSILTSKLAHSLIFSSISYVVHFPTHHTTTQVSFSCAMPIFLVPSLHNNLDSHREFRVLESTVCGCVFLFVFILWTKKHNCLCLWSLWSLQNAAGCLVCSMSPANYSVMLVNFALIVQVLVHENLWHVMKMGTSIQLISECLRNCWFLQLHWEENALGEYFSKSKTWRMKNCSIKKRCSAPGYINVEYFNSDIQIEFADCKITCMHL